MSGGLRFEACPECRASVRWLEVMGDHDKACPRLNDTPKTDKEKAQRLALYFEGLKEQWPEAEEAARLLRRLK